MLCAAKAEWETDHWERRRVEQKGGSDFREGQSQRFVFKALAIPCILGMSINVNNTKDAFLRCVVTEAVVVLSGRHIEYMHTASIHVYLNDN